MKMCRDGRFIAVSLVHLAPCPRTFQGKLSQRSRDPAVSSRVDAAPSDRIGNLYGASATRVAPCQPALEDGGDEDIAAQLEEESHDVRAAHTGVNGRIFEGVAVLIAQVELRFRRGSKK